MKRKLLNITNRIWSFSAIVVILLVWQLACSFEFVDSFMLPSPIKPGTITKEIVIKEPKPRGKDFNLTEEFLAYKREIISHLEGLE